MKLVEGLQHLLPGTGYASAPVLGRNVVLTSEPAMQSHEMLATRRCTGAKSDRVGERGEHNPKGSDYTYLRRLYENHRETERMTLSDEPVKSNAPEPARRFQSISIVKVAEIMLRPYSMYSPSEVVTSTSA